MILRYTDLVAWQKAMDLAYSSYQLSSGFPVAERYGITVQLREAAGSVAANIAEGHGRRSPRDFHRFLDIAYGSLNELQTYVRLAARLDYCSPSEAEALLDQADEVGRIVNGLQRALRQSPRKIARPRPDP